MITSYLFIALVLLVLLTLRTDGWPNLNVVVSVFWPITVPLIILIVVLHKLGVAVGFNIRSDQKFGHRRLYFGKGGYAIIAFWVEFYVYIVS